MRRGLLFGTKGYSGGEMWRRRLKAVVKRKRGEEGGGEGRASAAHFGGSAGTGTEEGLREKGQL